MIKTTTKVMAVSVVAAVLGLTFGEQAYHSYMRYKLERGVVMINNEVVGTGGSGWIYRNEGNHTEIITNAHVCEISATRGIPLYVDGHLFEISKIWDKHDLCYGTVTPALPGKSALTIRSRPLYKGEIVLAAGHPRLRPFTLTKGEVIDTALTIYLATSLVSDPKQCEAGTKVAKVLFFYACLTPFTSTSTTALIQPGNSGSPLVDNFGQVVGVIFAGDSQGRGEAVPLSYLKQFIQELEGPNE